MGSPDPTIIFLHIGKTAGASLRRILRRQFRSREILEFLPPRPEAGRLRREGALDAFARIPEERRARARLVMGHTTYGIHELLPRPSTYVTMLRDPIALVISLYRYIVRTPKHVLHHELVARDLSLEGFVTSGLSVEVDNSQTRALAGDVGTPFGGVDEAMRARAETHLAERFSVVGLTERFDESLLLMREAFGWKRVFYVATNVAPSTTPPPPETIELIRDRNRFDVALHAEAVARFADVTSAIPGFEQELERFRRLNRLYRPWGRLTDDLPRRAASRLSPR